MVDKNLFLHELAVVSILKNEGPYLKEWLDYHLLAGVNHFYLYDNDSPDNQREVAAPYVEAGLVDYIDAPGKMMQMLVYNHAVKRFKFHCRYMAFIDGDEFIYPKSDRTIAEIATKFCRTTTTLQVLQLTGKSSVQMAMRKRIIRVACWNVSRAVLKLISALINTSRRLPIRAG